MGSDVIQPHDLGYESWYQAYSHERNRADDLRLARDRWMHRALVAERALREHDCGAESLGYLGARHEWAIMGSVYRWGPFGYRWSREVTPQHFAFPPFSELWARFAHGARDVVAWFSEVVCAPWDRHHEPLRERIAQSTVATVPELVTVVRDYLEIRRLTARLQELA